MIVDNGKVSSENRNPDQSMMVFLTIVDLLDGLKKLLINEKNKEFTMIGADSSFMIQFNRLTNNQIAISVDNKIIDEINEADLAFSIYNACSIFYEKYQYQLSDDGVGQDIQLALRDFREHVLLLNQK
jgi:hypothetical protein